MNAVKIKYIIENGAFLGEQGINEWALRKEQILEALKEVKEKNMVVLGGDVLIKENSKYIHNYDSWSYEPDVKINREQNSSLSVQKTIDYICSYPLSSQIYFTLVIQ